MCVGNVTGNAHCRSCCYVLALHIGM